MFFWNNCHLPLDFAFTCFQSFFILKRNMSLQFPEKRGGSSVWLSHDIKEDLQK